MVPPPVLGARRHARPRTPHVVVHRSNEVECGCSVDEPPGALSAGIVAQLVPAAIGLQRRARHRKPVAEAPVDRRLGRPERGDRLAPLAHVHELLRHQPPQDPLPAVRRQDADPRHARAGHLSAGNGELELVRARERDRATIVEGRHRTLGGQRDPLALPVLIRDPRAEPLLGGVHRVPELLLRGLTDLDRHYTIFSSGA